MIKKLCIYFLIFLCTITIFLFGWHYYLGSSLIPRYQKKLTAIALQRSQEISDFLQKQESSAQELSQQSLVIESLSNTTNNNPLSAQQEESLALFFASLKEKLLFKDIFLINNNGTIIFSTSKKNIININIKNEKYIDSSLGKSYERALMTLTHDFSTFNFNELLDAAALFITIPIIHNKKFIGTLSYQIDESKIYLITHQYIGLGKTGEVGLSKKEGDYIVFVAPTRHDPDLAFKKRVLFENPPLSIQAATLGKEGSGTAIDYRGKEVVGAWKFIPKVDWGMIVKIDQEEILNPTLIIYQYALIFLLFLILYSIFFIWYFFPFIKKRILHFNSYFLPTIPLIFKNPLFLLAIVAICFCIKNSIEYKKREAFSVNTAQQEAIDKVTKNTELIDEILKKISFTANEFAHDLNTNDLKKDDISIRIKRELAENTILHAITVLMPQADNQPLIYSKTKKDDSLSKETALLLTQTKWYTETLKNKSGWFINRDNPTSLTATYTCLFKDEEYNKEGIIAFTCYLDSIKEIAESMSIGQTGYSIILDNNGNFIFHPIKSLIQKPISLLQYAQTLGNEELASIATQITNNAPLMEFYTSEITKERYYIYITPIPTTKWFIGTIFSENEIDLAAQTRRHYYFWIIIWITCAFLLLCSLLYMYNYLSRIHYSLITTLLLCASLILTWLAIQQTTIVDREKRVIIADQSTLDKFLNDLKDDAERKHEPSPIVVPCGILLYSISLPSPDHITVSGYIWNKYDTSLPITIERGMDLPQANALTFGFPLLSKTDSIETVTMNIQGTLFQEQNYKLYPFDQHHIHIILEHRDIEKNIILTPDLDSYKKISPEATPGLDKEFVLPGFKIQQTFFEYKNINPSVNFGFKEYGKVTDYYQLIYNAILSRNLLTPFIFYFLPLLVILFSLFSTLLITTQKTDPLTILGTYSGLFFAMILLQRSLREQYPTGATLYMEYAFFYTYITIMLLILHIILTSYYKRWKTYYDPVLYYMKVAFWPFQLILWLITTFIVFY